MRMQNETENQVKSTSSTVMQFFTATDLWLAYFCIQYLMHSSNTTFEVSLITRQGNNRGLPAAK